MNQDEDYSLLLLLKLVGSNGADDYTPGRVYLIERTM